MVVLPHTITWVRVVPITVNSLSLQAPLFASAFSIDSRMESTVPLECSSCSDVMHALRVAVLPLEVTVFSQSPARIRTLPWAHPATASNRGMNAVFVLSFIAFGLLPRLLNATTDFGI